MVKKCRIKIKKNAVGGSPDEVLTSTSKNWENIKPKKMTIYTIGQKVKAPKINLLDLDIIMFIILLTNL